MTPDDGRDFAAALGWMRRGTEVFLAALDRLTDGELAGATALDGWTRSHLVAHVAANADALRNLAHWASTGQERPMYASPEQRDADIQTGSRRRPDELRHSVRASAAALAQDLAGLSDVQWATPVRTAQGRTVPATEVPWLRSREVMVHAVDLRAGVTFEDLPGEFLTALIDDITAKRSGDAGPALQIAPDDVSHSWTVQGSGDPATIHGPLAAVAAYLAGRSSPDATSHQVMTADGRPLPSLPRWL